MTAVAALAVGALVIAAGLWRAAALHRSLSAEAAYFAAAFRDTVNVEASALRAELDSAKADLRHATDNMIRLRQQVSDLHNDFHVFRHQLEQGLVVERIEAPE